jgi:hypothetical protein
MKKSIRNIIIFSMAAVGSGFLGAFLDRGNPPQDSMEGLGVLIWLVAPLVVNILLRLFGGDGWRDFGFKPNFRKSWKWYLVAIAIVPVIVAITMGLGVAVNAISLPGFSQKGVNTFIPLAIAAFVGSLVKNIFEEFAWRGYLTSRFNAIKLHPFVSSILTGFVWAGWHIPYYLYFLDRSVLEAHTTLSMPAFILMAFLLLPLQALAYGELRLLSKSVWPSWLLHNFANALSLPLLSYGFVTLNKGFAGVLLSPGSEGLLYSLLMGSAGLWMYRIRMRNPKN